MPQHRALYLESKFGRFTLGHNETPQPGPGELLVRVEAAALNSVDWSIQKKGLFVEKYPAILGTDAAGVVVGVGKGVSDFAFGDRVYVFTTMIRCIAIEVFSVYTRDHGQEKMLATSSSASPAQRRRRRSPDFFFSQAAFDK
jgi:NADPH:quinone reductase-like Zn-dependent oxidoreductase